MAKPKAKAGFAGAPGSANRGAAFKRERNEALLSLDANRIRGMVRKWNGTEMTGNPLIFWGAIHKWITGCLDLPIDFRRKSKAWLDAHDLRSFDDGDLSSPNSEIRDSR